MLILGAAPGEETVAGPPHADAPAALLDVFPESPVLVPADRLGETRHASVYTPSGSRWGKGLDEATVFQHEISHLQDEHNGFSARLGRGGQLYSLRGAFGESIPPQGRGNPWNDEVWQFVAVCSGYNWILDGLAESGVISSGTWDAFRESAYEETYFIHNSGAYMQAPIDSGLITISFDIMLDADRPGIFLGMLRDNNNPPWRTFGGLHFNERGISFNQRQVAEARAGAWYHIQLEFKLAPSGTNSGLLRVRSPEGQETASEVPFTEAPISTFHWMALSASGNHEGLIYIDNLSIRRDSDLGTEWLVRDDFEDYQPGDYVFYTAGVDEEKGGRSFVSDRVAVSGKNALALQDAPGLESPWHPAVRLELKSDLGGAMYCPLLAEDVPDPRSYRTVNWGFVPQLKTIHRSPLLYYVQTRDAGDGILEITYVVHNFSARDDVVFDWLNAPWGGTRATSLPHHYVGAPSGELWDMDKISELNFGGGVNVRDTGGWNLSAAGEADDSPSLAFVFGRDRHLETEREKARNGQPCGQIDHSIYRDWTSRDLVNWEKWNEIAWRNYDIAVVIPRFRLAPGVSIWYRSFLVVNRKDRAIELAKSLVDRVDYGLRVFDPESTPRVTVEQEGLPSFGLYAHPVPGTMPLFLVENASSGREVVTSDPYIFVPQEELGLDLPPDHPKADYYNQAVGYSLGENNSNWKRLLGYGFREKPAAGNWVQLSSLLEEKHFPAATAYHLDLWVAANNP